MKKFHSILSTTVALATLLPTASATLNWGNCTTSDPPRLQCAQLEVPMNWAEPNGTTITLGIARFQVADPSQKIGSLVYNPGGPGGSAAAEVMEQANGGKIFSVCVFREFPPSEWILRLCYLGYNHKILRPNRHGPTRSRYQLTYQL